MEKQNKEKAAAAAAVAAEELEKTAEENEIKSEQVGDEMQEARPAGPDETPADQVPTSSATTIAAHHHERPNELSTSVNYNETISTTNNQLATAGPNLTSQISSLPSNASNQLTAGLVPNLLHSSLSSSEGTPSSSGSTPQLAMPQHQPQHSQAPPPQQKLIQPTAQMQLNQILNNNLQQQQQPPPPPPPQQQATLQAPQMMRLSDFFTSASSQPQATQAQQPFQASSLAPPLPSPLNPQQPQHLQQSGWLIILNKQLICWHFS